MTLRHWDKKDIDSLHDILFKEEDISYWCGFPHPKTKEETEVYLQELSRREHWYCIDLNDEIAGCISLTRISEGEWELGYWLCQRYRHKGIMQEAIKLLKEKAFIELKATKILCGWFEGNEDSRRCQMRSGFKYLKTIRVQTAQGIRTEYISEILTDKN